MYMHVCILFNCMVTIYVCACIYNKAFEVFTVLATQPLMFCYVAIASYSIRLGIHFMKASTVKIFLWI